MPKRIAFLLPDLRVGGAETMRVRLAETLTRRGYQCEFWLSSLSGELLSEAKDHSRLFDLGAGRIRNLYFPLKKCWLERSPDILVADMWPNTVVAAMCWKRIKERVRNGKLVVCEQNTLSLKPECRGAIRKQILSKSVRWSYPWADTRVTVSAGVADDLVEISGLSRHQFSVIYNPGFTSPQDVAVRNPWPNATLKLLCVGSLKEQKGFSDAIRAFAKLDWPGAKLAIIGEGRLRTELENLALELKVSDRVVMPGYSNQVHEWYAHADVFCLSSRWEGFGIVILEALQHGVQIVSTNCRSGPAEILENGLHGWLVPVGDPEALADAIREATQTPYPQEQLRARAADFDIESIADQYLKLFFPESFES